MVQFECAAFNVSKIELLPKISKHSRHKVRLWEIWLFAPITPKIRRPQTPHGQEQALSYLDRSLQLGKGDKDLLLNAAVVYNQLRETGTALEWLSKALAAGYSKSVVRKTPDLDNLHDNPRYQALMQQK